MKLETAQRLFEYRKANGYSQEELADKIGVSRQAISKWERSESSPDTDNLIALADLYGVTIDELLNGKKEPKREAPKFEQSQQPSSNYSQQYNYIPPTDETFGTPDSEKPRRHIDGVYYSPSGVSAAPSKSGRRNTVAIIIAAVISFIILAITVVSIVSIITGFKIVSGFDINNFIPAIEEPTAGFEYNYDDAESYDIGSGEVDADKIDKIQIAWMSGSVTVEYYDGDTIKFTEPEQPSPNYELRHRTSKNELQIQFCKSDVNYEPHSNKDLCVQLPQGFPLDRLKIQSASATVTLNDVDSKELAIETVSGKITARGSFEVIDIDSLSAEADIKTSAVPKSIDVNTMSGSTRVTVPSEIAGFTLNFNSMSGNYELNNFDLSSFGKDSSTWGNGKTKIDYNSMSGNLTLTRSE